MKAGETAVWPHVSDTQRSRMVTEKLGCLHTSFEQFPQYQHRHHVFLSTSIVCNGLAPVHPVRVIAAKLTTG
jgi:hypothetical protein